MERGAILDRGVKENLFEKNVNGPHRRGGRQLGVYFGKKYVPGRKTPANPKAPRHAWCAGGAERSELDQTGQGGREGDQDKVKWDWEAVGRT